MRGRVPVRRRRTSPADFDLMGRTTRAGDGVDQVAIGGPLAYRHEDDRLTSNSEGRAGRGAGLGRDPLPWRARQRPPDRPQPVRRPDLSSDNWPDLARNWLVGIDHPYDKATSEFMVTAPARYQVVSNGRLVEETDLGNGLRRTHWRESVPIATWLQTLGSSGLRSRSPGGGRRNPVEAWVYPQDRDQGFADSAGRRRRRSASSRPGGAVFL